MFTILIVCTANICRSPMMERLLRRALEGANNNQPKYIVESAGVRGWDGAPMDQMAAEQLRRLGGDPEGFAARSLQDAHVEAADLVLTATQQHRAAVLSAVPRALRRTFTLLELAHLVTAVPTVREAVGQPQELVRQAAAARGAATLDGYGVGDPYGQPEDVHAAAAQQIHEAVRAIALALWDDKSS